MVPLNLWSVRPTRRVIVHSTIFDHIKKELIKAYNQIKIGSPLDESNHMGPLIDQNAVEQYMQAINDIKDQGGKFVIEGGVLEGKKYNSSNYVKPVKEVKMSMKLSKKKLCPYSLFNLL